MKNHSQVGKRVGRPTYRTPSRFIARKTVGNASGRVKAGKFKVFIR